MVTKILRLCCRKSKEMGLAFINSDISNCHLTIKTFNLQVGKQNLRMTGALLGAGVLPGLGTGKGECMFRSPFPNSIPHPHPGGFPQKAPCRFF